MKHKLQLTPYLTATPILVASDEYSETAGFIIQGPNNKVLYPRHRQMGKVELITV
jgi:hypothetical protein